MNNVIWRYELNATEKNSILIPENSEILSIQAHNDIICMWIKVNPVKRKVKRIFEIIETGIPMSEIDIPRKFISTVQLFNGKMILHVFENIYNKKCIENYCETKAGNDLSDYEM